MSKILSAKLAIDAPSLSYAFYDPEYGKIEAGWDKSLSVDGKAENYKGFTPEGVVEFEEV